MAINGIEPSNDYSSLLERVRGVGATLVKAEGGAFLDILRSSAPALLLLPLGSGFVRGEPVGRG